MKLYGFYDMHNKKLGTLKMENDTIVPDFADPTWQLHFLEQIKMWEPETMSDLIRGGYTYYQIIEE